MHAVRQQQQAMPVTHGDICGICAGTTLLTLDGEIPVEHLTVGDRIITRDNGMAVLRSTTRRVARVTPIVVKAGSFGHTRPDREAVILPTTKVLIRDWRAPALYGTKDALVAARDLIDGEFVSWGAAQDMPVFALAFDAPHILYADGLEVQSA